MSRSSAAFELEKKLSGSPADLKPIPEQEEDDNEPQVAPGKQQGTSDPNRFFLHTKHILNRVEEAIFASPVLCRPNPQNFGALYHFPPLAQPARLAGQGTDPNQREQRAPSEVVASVLATARRPVTAPPLCEPSPPCKALNSKPQPLLLVSGHTSWFHVVRECLTLREYMLVSRMNHQMRKLTLEATQYWQKRFKLLCLGPHIFVPEFSNATLRRWVKVLYLQQALAHHKRQLDLNLVVANQLQDPVRETTVNALTTQFRSRTHQCGLCNADVPYSLHLDNNHKKVVDIVQMACPACFATKLWTSKQAAALWGIPRTKLKDVACWRLPSVLWYSTPDLYESWVQMDLSQRNLDRQLITPELAQRYKDLPPTVQRTVTLNKSEDGSLPPEFDLESNLSLFRDDDLDEPMPDAKRGGVRSAVPRIGHGGPVHWLTYLKRAELPHVDLKKEFHDAPPIQLLPPLSHVFLPGGLSAAGQGLPEGERKVPADRGDAKPSVSPGRLSPRS